MPRFFIFASIRLEFVMLQGKFYYALNHKFEYLEIAPRNPLCGIDGNNGYENT